MDTEVLATIRHDDGLPAAGRVLERRAVKAVARRGREVLLLRTAGLGALKFPGGGVEPEESDAAALRRELDEECGMSLLSVDGHLGDVVQLARPREPEYDVFRMVSHYVHCTVTDGSGVQRLDDYERRLGLTPVWVDLSAAAESTAELVGTGVAVPRWVERELAVLRVLQGRLDEVP